jgi:hypothetical protein
VLLDENRLEDLRRMFVLFGRVKGQGLLQQAWGLYIRCVVLSAEQTLNAAYYILHIAVYYILHTTYCTLYTVYCPLYTVNCMLHSTYCVLHTAQRILYTEHCGLLTASMFASLYSATCACVNKAV